MSRSTRPTPRCKSPGVAGFQFGMLALVALLAFVVVRPVVAAGVNQDEEIVYIDPNGVIRVFDPIQTADNLPVQWVSPTGGWHDLALGDFTGDGSMEIVAVGQNALGAGILAIYDPVYVGPNPAPGQQINGINWVAYFQTEFPTVPTFVETGTFEGGGDLAQIVLSRPLLPSERSDPNDLHRLQVWRAASNPPTATAWTVIATFDSPYAWDWIAAGDFTGNNLDEIAVIDRTRGHLGVFRVGANRVLERLYANESAERPWQTVAFGQYTVSASDEMVAARLGSVLNHVWAFRWVNNQVTDFFSAFFLPPPRFVFLADIGGNGDVEMVVLRSVPPDISGRPRLFVRDNGNDPIALREADLERDNGFLAGAGGDLNGDRRDAIVLIRDNRIRIYYEPYRNRDFVDYPLPTNRRTVHTGNLDASGQRPIPRLDVVPRTLTANVIQGQVLSTLFADVVSRDVDEPLEFTATTQAAQTWLSVNPAFGRTPSRITLEVDTRNLPPSTFTGPVSISSQTSGLLQTVELNVTITVQPGIRLTPEQATVAYAPCDERAPAQNLVFAVNGAAGTVFRTELFPEANWVAVQPAEATVPGSVTVTVQPGLLQPGTNATVTLAVRAQNNSAPAFNPEAEIRVVCSASFLFLPSVDRAD